MLTTHVEGDISGKSLQSMDADQLRQFATDFRNNVEQLRRIPNPYPHLICSSSGGPCRDGRIDHEDDKSGPYNSVEDLHKYLVSICAPLKDPADRSLIAEVHSRPHRVFFAHADLNPGNVLVHNGRLSGFVDWEYAGWYPEYWEHTKSCYIVHRWGLWLETMGKAFPQYTDELKTERIFQNYTCPF